MIRVGYTSDSMIKIDEYEINEVNYVLSIQNHHIVFDKSTYPYGWDVEFDIANNNIVEHYYLYIDTLFHDAFSHWVFESGIYLVLFNKLKAIYPNIKIYCKDLKSYKMIFFKAFNIDESSIVNYLEKNNKVFFPRYQSFHIFSENYTQSNDTKLDSNYPIYLNNFYNSLINPIKNIEKNIDILYLPRGTKENFKPNDRIINIQDSLINYFSNKNNCKVLYTDNINNFNEQINYILRSKIILLDYGSNLFVNSFFANNSQIVVLGYDIHHEIHVIVDILYKEANKRNKITYINKINQEGSMPIRVNFNLEETIKTVLDLM
jgi:hypothetical protein